MWWIWNKIYQQRKQCFKFAKCLILFHLCLYIKRNTKTISSVCLCFQEEQRSAAGVLAAAVQKVPQEKGLPETSHLQDFPKGRQDSTESEISTIYSQSQSDACHKMM